MGRVGKPASQSGAARGDESLGGDQKPMEGTDVSPVRARHHVLECGATPRRRALCAEDSEAPSSGGVEGRSGHRAAANVWSSDWGSTPQTCIAADSSAAVAPHGAAGTWRPTSVGSSFPVQEGVDLGTGAGPGTGLIRCNVRVEQAVVTRHGCRRGQTSKGSCTTGKTNLALLLRQQARGDAGKVVNPRAGARRNRLAGDAAEKTVETVRNREDGTGRAGWYQCAERHSRVPGSGRSIVGRRRGGSYEPHERRRSAGIVGVYEAR